MSDVIWSSTDSPYTCLKDMERTLAFREVIVRAVRPGDVVVEAGAGTGILSLFAAAAGAAHVYAVEIDGLLVESLRETVRRNGLQDRITVIAGDAATAPLPAAVDVFIAELLETGLIDEQQLRVASALRDRGVIGPQTTLLPERYVTSVELVVASTEFYGFSIAAPFHEWPNYRTDIARWHPTSVRALTKPAQVLEVDFRTPTAPAIDLEVTVRATSAGVANAVRLSGVAGFPLGHTIGQTNAVNGDKIVQLPEPIDLCAGELARLRVQFEMGGGLRTLRTSLAPLPELVG